VIENREIFYTPPVFSAPAEDDPSEFRSFDAGKTRMIAWATYGKKL